MMSMEFFWLLALLGGGWYWYTAMRAKELARRIGRERCDEAGLVFLDDSVVLTHLRLRRDALGRLALQRRYAFEFTRRGDVRYGGDITLLGEHVIRVEMEPYPDHPDHGPTDRS